MSLLGSVISIKEFGGSIRLLSATALLKISVYTDTSIGVRSSHQVQRHRPGWCQADRPLRQALWAPLTGAHRALTRTNWCCQRFWLDVAWSASILCCFHPTVALSFRANTEDLHFFLEKIGGRPLREPRAILVSRLSRWENNPALGQSPQPLCTPMPMHWRSKVPVVVQAHLGPSSAQ